GFCCGGWPWVLKFAPWGKANPPPARQELIRGGSESLPWLRLADWRGWWVSEKFWEARENSAWDFPRITVSSASLWPCWDATSRWGLWLRHCCLARCTKERRIWIWNRNMSPGNCRSSFKPSSFCPC